MLKNKIAIWATATMFLVTSFFAYVSARGISQAQKTLNNINSYQQKYFEIIKRNDVLLRFEEADELNTDRKALDNLFIEVEKQITNESYLKKYKKIQKRYSECDGVTTPEINKCAEKNYKAVDRLLDNVYQKAENKLNFQDSKNLATSEISWEKDVEDYQKVFDSMEFGTIGTSIYYDYQTNMKEFRTLLLMFYL